jgi:hypothetical protein
MGPAHLVSILEISVTRCLRDIRHCHMDLAKEKNNKILEFISSIELLR